MVVLMAPENSVQVICTTNLVTFGGPNSILGEITHVFGFKMTINYKCATAFWPFWGWYYALGRKNRVKWSFFLVIGLWLHCSKPQKTLLWTNLYFWYTLYGGLYVSLFVTHLLCFFLPSPIEVFHTNLV